MLEGPQKKGRARGSLGTSRLILSLYDGETGREQGGSSTRSQRWLVAPSPALCPLPGPTRHSPCLACVLQVSRESIFNKMNSSNLACVFGLNLIWPSQGASSLSALVPLNLFTELLIEYHGKVFSAPDARGELGAGSGGGGEQGSPSSRGISTPAAPPSTAPLSAAPLSAAPPSPGTGLETPLVLAISR